MPEFDDMMGSQRNRKCLQLSAVVLENQFILNGLQVILTFRGLQIEISNLEILNSSYQVLMQKTGLSKLLS